MHTPVMTFTTTEARMMRLSPGGSVDLLIDDASITLVLPLSLETIRDHARANTNFMLVGYEAALWHRALQHTQHPSIDTLCTYTEVLHHYRDACSPYLTHGITTAEQQAIQTMLNNLVSLPL